MKTNEGGDQLCSYCTADLHLYFCIDAKIWFSDDVAHMVIEARSIT